MFWSIAATVSLEVAAWLVQILTTFEFKNEGSGRIKGPHRHQSFARGLLTYGVSKNFSLDIFRRSLFATTLRIPWVC